MERFKYYQGVAMLQFIVLLSFPNFLRADPGSLWGHDTSFAESTGLTGFGSASAISPSGKILAIGAPSYDVGTAHSAGALHVFMHGVNGWTPAGILKSSSPNSNANLGFSIVVTEDRIVGGAPGSNNNAGRLMPFSLSGLTWVTQPEIIGLSDNRLGERLATDGTFLLSGATGFSSGAGLIYVYTINESNFWEQSTTLSASTSGICLIGSTVSVQYGFILSSAPGELGNQGAGYVWSVSGNTIATTAQRITTATALTGNPSMGKSSAIISITMVALGCATSDVVYFFSYAANTWSQMFALNAPYGTKHFGAVMASNLGYVLIGSEGGALVYSVSGNVVSSSFMRLLPTDVTITAFYGFTSISMNGLYAIVGDFNMYSIPISQRAHLFRHPVPVTQSPAPTINSVAPQKKSKSKTLGYKVALWNDIAIISVPFCAKISGSCDGGYILLFQKNLVSNEWLFNTKIRNPFRNRENKFGYSIEVNKNYLLVSVPESYYDNKNTGVIVIYKWSPSKNTFLKDSIIRFRNSDKSRSLGTAMSNFNDVTAIGMPDYETMPGVNFGGAHIFRKQSSGKWRERKTIISPMPATGEFFGQSISLQSETRVAVSNKPPSPTRQAVYIYDFIDDKWKWFQTITDSDNLEFGWKIQFFGETLYVSSIIDVGLVFVYQPDAQLKYASSYSIKPTNPVPGDNFGTSFSTDGIHFVVGTNPCVNGVACGTPGSVYTFTRNSNNEWAQQFSYALGDADGSDGFGFDVAISGDTVLVSAPFKATSTGNGVAYFIRK